MKLEKLVIHEQALIELSQIPLKDAQSAWDLSISLDTAKGHLKKFNEKKDALIKRLGTPVKDNPENYEIKEAGFKEFNDELTKLTGVDVKVSFPKVTLEMLKGVEVSAANISAWREIGLLTKK